jgi:GTP cyclohydrolase I
MQKNLPDVAKEQSLANLSPLDWVGMEGIELPIHLSAGEYRLPAKVDAKVSLDKTASRGIHMSRLYLISQEKLSKSELSLKLLGEATEDFLKTHAELSTSAQIKVHFDAPLLRPALKTANEAWRSYPVILSALNQAGKIRYFVDVLVTYSSTCPASAALARQLIQDKFKLDFVDQKFDFEKVHAWLGTTQGIVATPHAQRSFARVKVEVGLEYNFKDLIEITEDALQTAVQGAVKREDEQEFALRNGQNLMFCEDAARRVKKALESRAEVLDYLAEFNHVESLHPHSAVSRTSKGRQLSSF